MWGVVEGRPRGRLRLLEVVWLMRPAPEAGGATPSSREGGLGGNRRIDESFNSLGALVVAVGGAPLDRHCVARSACVRPCA